MDERFIGAMHDAEVNPDVVYVGNVTPLDFGYNKNPPAEWVIDDWVGHTH